ncbi:MAG TPA: hypothetical protein VGE38_14500 [Nocardioides sp.]|uniref:hypothetical protein n=1 Tax=Nocardioides sp. TaxID=35761 RepID=UPI002ED83324
MKRATLLMATVGLVGAAAVGGTALASVSDERKASEPLGAVLAAARSALPASAADVHGELGGELLSVDLPGDGSAEVVLYDYAADLTHQITVRGGDVVDSQTARVQPPPTATEATAALGIALDRPLPLPFAAAFAERQGVPLVSPDQVSVIAGAWTTDGSGAAADCGHHRCVQLVVATPAGDYLDTHDFVVDLSTGTVINLGAPR